MSQLEFNYMPIASEARARDQQDLMSFPCFSLSKKKRTDILRFEDSKGNFVEVSPNPKYGMATVWDFDVMLYFVAYIRHLVDNGSKIPKVFKVSGYDVLKFCGKNTGKSQYEQLRHSLERLSSTLVSTNIREDTITDDEVERKNSYLNFTWVSFKEETVTRINKKSGKKKEVSKLYEIQLPQWFVDGVVNSQLVLAINPSYFKLTGGLERWLYRTARKFSGINPSGLRYRLRHMHQRSGSKASYRRFKQAVKETIEKGNIPDYNFAVYESEGVEYLFFSAREQSSEESLADFESKINSFKLLAESPNSES